MYIVADGIRVSLFVSRHLSAKSTQKYTYTVAKTELNVKWPFKVIQGHKF